MLRIFFTLLFCCYIPSSQAVEFDIFQSGHTPLRLAWKVHPDAQTSSWENLIYHTVKNDLESSQSFTVLDPLSFIGDLSPSKALDYADWRIIGTDVIVQCQIYQHADGVVADINIHDPFQHKELISYQLNGLPQDQRHIAHSIANSIYEKIIGVPGYFLSHIVYVKRHHNKANLVFMDQDGFNQQTAASNFELLLSPDWSPDGFHIALNTYVGGKTKLERLNLQSGKRETFAAFKGLNSTPEHSPDGRYIAAALSITGNVDIHIYDTITQRWRQFTNHPSIDTTPTWSPDGKKIAFVSNRTGNPHIYIQDINSSKPKRITGGETNYNTSPAWSPQGDRIAMITKKAWEYALGTVKTDGSDIRYLITGTGIESPSWSPNGQMLLYSQETKRGRRVYRIPNWGGKAEPITSSHEDASDPAWSHQ